MGSDFWAKKLGGIAQPQPPAPPQQPANQAWWQPPQPPPQQQQQYGYPQQGYDPALQAQMPYPQSPTGQHLDQYVKQLQRMPTEDLSQEQMEQIAAWELANKAKYNSHCPQCGSANFAPQGTRLGNTTLGSDKCFDCGASSSTYTSSPEPARGGGGKASKAPWRDVRQIDTGGAGGASMYLKFRGTPSSYMPRG